MKIKRSIALSPISVNWAKKKQKQTGDSFSGVVDNLLQKEAEKEIREMRNAKNN